MWFKETLKKEFFEDNNRVFLRYKSSKIILVLCIFIFFVSFYFVWAWFYNDIFIPFMSISYVLLCFSIVLYLFYYFKKTFLEKLKGIKLYLFIFFLFLMFFILISRIFLEWGISWLLEQYLSK